MPFEIAIATFVTCQCHNYFATLATRKPSSRNMNLALPPPHCAHDIFQYGCLIAGYKTAATKSEEQVTKADVGRFRSSFGVSPEAIACLIDDLNLQAVTERYTPPKAKELLITLNWLCEYSTESSMSGRFQMSELTIRRKIKANLERIYELRDKKVSFHRAFLSVNMYYLTFMIPTIDCFRLQSCQRQGNRLCWRHTLSYSRASAKSFFQVVLSQVQETCARIRNCFVAVERPSNACQWALHGGWWRP